MALINLNLCIDDTTGKFIAVNPETGETFELSKISAPKEKKATKKSDGSTIPTITLESNKYSFNSAAVELMKLEAGSRICIKMEKNGTKLVPVIGKDEAFECPGSGNKVTKSFTVACRGHQNEELAKYGDTFIIKAHSSKDGIFILEGNKQLVEVVDVQDENVEITDEDITNDLDLLGVSEDKDLTAFDFTL
jgi:hypothetical protein